MVDLQVSGTNFSEYNFLDSADKNVMHAMISSNRAGFFLVKIKTDSDEAFQMTFKRKH